MPNLYLEKMRETVLGKRRDTMSEEEKAVMSILWHYIGIQKVTQNEIARSERWMGCHPTHEADIRSNKLETTTRQVRQIIRDLRINHGMPIISDKGGYWLPTSQDEATNYIVNLEREVKSQIASWHETYAAMKESLNATSSLLDQLPIV